MPDFSPLQWTLAIVAAVGMGISKGGLAGIGLLHVVIFAFLFGARDSTGVVLPMLIIGDICAVTLLHQHARWDYVWRMLPPACLGVILGTALMGRVTDEMFKPLIGWIILTLAVMQLARTIRPAFFGNVPHNRWFAWTTGLIAGVTTMLANAAGPVFGLYLLSVSLPKFEIVGTGAWLFLILNLFKVPFSAGLGLIHWHTLLFNLAMAPIIFAGVLGGRWLTHRLPQRMFDAFLLAFAAIAALRLIGFF